MNAINDTFVYCKLPFFIILEVSTLHFFYFLCDMLVSSEWFFLVKRCHFKAFEVYYSISITTFFRVFSKLSLFYLFWFPFIKFWIQDFRVAGPFSVCTMYYVTIFSHNSINNTILKKKHKVITKVKHVAIKFLFIKLKSRHQKQ